VAAPTWQARAHSGPSYTTLLDSTITKSAEDRTALIYVGYALLMRDLQLMELHLWTIQALGIKRNSTEAQAFAKVEKWDGTTFGALVRGMKGQAHWPEGMAQDLEQAVALRNHLAHNFLREFFLTEPSEANFERGTQQLLDWSLKVDDLDDRLRIHAHTLGVPDPEELDDEMLAELDDLRPKTWPLSGGDTPAN
jgi:hypothetical protein